MPPSRFSTQSLLLRLRFDGQDLSTATGFVVRGLGGTPTLVTNRHVLTGRDQTTGKLLSKTGGVPNEVVIVHNRADAPGEWIEKVERLEKPDGTPRWYGHPELGDAVDLAALALSELSDVDMHYTDISSSTVKMQLGPADVVSVIGFPFGRTAGKSYAIWATGFIASELDVDFDEKPVFLIDCRSRQGQSGSPVVAYRGGGAVAMEDGATTIFDKPVARFLGVYSGRISEQSDLGMVWKADVLRGLLYWQHDY